MLVIWLSVGIIGSMAATAMYISGSFNLFRFYDVGKVYDINYFTRQAVPSRSESYISSSDSCVFEILSHGASKRIMIDGEDTQWKYIDVEIGNLNRETMEWTLAYFDDEYNPIHRELFLLTEGHNVLTLDSKAPFSYFDIIIENDPGLTFSLETMQLREQVPLFQLGRFAKLMLFFFGIYMVLTLACHYLLKKKTTIRFSPSILTDKLQKIYIKVGDYLYIHTKKIKSPVRSWIRTLLFLVLIVYTVMVFNLGHHFILWEIGQKLYLVCLVGIAIVSIEDKLQLVNWKNNLVYSWCIFWIFACISDFVVSKTFFFVGYAQLCVFGFLFFCWNNMKQPRDILREFMNALDLSFYIGLFFCMFFYPVTEGERYKGFFINPNIFANFLIIIIAVSLSQLFDLLHKKDKAVLKKYFILYAGKFGVAFYYIWKTQSRSALLTVVVLMLILSIACLQFLKEQRKLKSVAALLLLLCLCGAPFLKTDVEAVQGAQIQVATDDSENPFDTKAVIQMVHFTDSRVFKSFTSGSLERISSGRTLFWAAYIREMNLWGHKYKATVNGRSRDAHNAFLSVAHRYGVFSIIPYICLWYFSLKYAYRYLKNRKHFAFLPISLCVSFMIISSLDTEEQPYIKFLWFAMYFIIGILFPNEEAQNE